MYNMIMQYRVPSEAYHVGKYKLIIKYHHYTKLQAIVATCTYTHVHMHTCTYVRMNVCTIHHMHNLFTDSQNYITQCINVQYGVLTNSTSCYNKTLYGVLYIE